MKIALNGWLSGFIGVMIFAGSLPATRAAIGGFDPLFLTCARATIAALLGGALLMVLRQKRPALTDIPALAITALGVVVGFPLLTALAVQHISSARSMVFLGLLPMSTAIFAVLRGGERPRPVFWLFSLAGSAIIAGYALGGTAGNMMAGDVLMIAAIILCGLGYAEGAKLSRRLGGWQVISWALLVAVPVMLPAAIYTAPATFSGIAMPAWLGLAWVSVFSMLIGFIFWYHGLAKGGIAAVGQLQLIQPFMGFALAALLLHESISWAMLAVAGATIMCVFGAKRYAS
ncbi:DMT family transporter [Pantoea phytobeneficialis]|uniref:DMT family transporter n=1 Tax=Pantoea phytobeneficialis TaxID=2052056 RepID=A0AAP9HAB9_9GAMM|nr:DMT family transporter [Pantoea phytobeneficialis]MDO6406840.1 DMT family transporter [Pantoea phytobeneficialis]QGR09362.1 EamA family transporter [Pantoea phytobeneficialis]